MKKTLTKHIVIIIHFSLKCHHEASLRAGTGDWRGDSRETLDIYINTHTHRDKCEELSAAATAALVCVEKVPVKSTPRSHSSPDEGQGVVATSPRASPSPATSVFKQPSSPAPSEAPRLH